jgi:lipopolysaccharide/colanic/teichoic acid biosynthesis glycosyltransferase
METEIEKNYTLVNDPDVLCKAEKRTIYFVIKKMIDVLIAATLLIILSPLLSLIAIMIRFSSPGSIFFVQKRVGSKRVLIGNEMYWKKQIFPCYKFRTMYTNSDPSIHQAYVKALIKNDKGEMSAMQNGKTTPIRKLINDPRITPVGKLLRKLSLDELPQFWNVLCGEMSLVGPRPAIPYEVEMYKPWYKRRLEAQPGITGLQQVNARCTVDFEQQVLLDISYIDHQSLWLDIVIIFKTPFVILSTKGAE